MYQLKIQNRIFLTPYVFFVIFSFFSITDNSVSQHLSGTYTTSAPEASLFFLNPGYLNPAFGSGAFGMFSNPAGLYVVRGNEISIAFTTSYASSANFSLTAVDESSVYEPINIDTQLKIEESGGLAGIGYAREMGKWHFGVALMQARKGGIRLQAQGTIDLETQFDLEEAITREILSDLPVDEIPMTWDVDTQATFTLSSTPAELYLSILPIITGVSYSSKHFSLGAGLTYYNLSSSNQTGQITTYLDSRNSIIGKPHGNDPITGLPWQGQISADVFLHDQPMIAKYQFDVSGNRFALSLGGMMNYKLLSLGVTYQNGFRATINGHYNLSSITSSDLPTDNLLSDVNIDFSAAPTLSGHASLDISNFAKDTLNTYDSGDIQVGGYQSFSLGAHFLIFGLFGGAEIPKSFPDIYTIFFGLYTDFPIPKTPVRLNFGFIHRSDGFADKSSYSVPYRISTHLGGGIAFQLPLNEWINFGEYKSWVRIGIRSSLTSYALNIIDIEASESDRKKLPSPFESMAFSMGMDMPF